MEFMEYDLRWSKNKVRQFNGILQHAVLEDKQRPCHPCYFSGLVSFWYSAGECRRLLVPRSACSKSCPASSTAHHDSVPRTLTWSAVVELFRFCVAPFAHNCMLLTRPRNNSTLNSPRDIDRLGSSLISPSQDQETQDVNGALKNSYSHAGT